jgi:hypothetical protein
MISNGNMRMYFAGSMFVAAGLLTFSVKLTRAGDSERNVEYEYKEDLTRQIEMLRGRMVHVGHLDARGNFVPKPGQVPYDIRNPRSVVGPGEIVNIRRSPGNTEPVYEYRSGLMIKGTLDDEGDFTPEVGSRITSFKDYRYRQDALRIYNLPGKFVEKTAPKKKKDGPDGIE